MLFNVNNKEVLLILNKSVSSLTASVAHEAVLLLFNAIS